MKKFNKILLSLGIGALLLGSSSCVNDLDMQPNNPKEITDVANDMDAVFADIYLNFVNSNADALHDFDGGMAVFQRAIFILEEFCTDESSWMHDFEDYGTLNYGYITPDNNLLYGAYSRLMINIALCNDFISSVGEGKFNLDAEGQKRAEEYCQQARILRAACYFYLLSFYENPPYADDSTPIGAMPTQPGRSEVYRLVTENLEQVVAWYKENPRETSYGFVGLDAAEAILAKIYLNGEVFAGRADYDKCLAHSEAIISRLGHGGVYGTGLAPTYSALFGYNNDKYAIGKGENGVTEIIWPIPASKEFVNGNVIENLTSWGGSTFMIAGNMGSQGASVTVRTPTQDAEYANKTGIELFGKNSSGEDVWYEYYSAEEEYKKAKEAYDALLKSNAKKWQVIVKKIVNTTGYSLDPSVKGQCSGDWVNATEGWKGMVARRQFVEKFPWEDAGRSVSKDNRVKFWLTSAENFSIDSPSLVSADWGNNGYITIKYSNWVFDEDGNIDFEKSADIQKNALYGGDWAQIRLAEVYLMAAEAILKGGGGSIANATQYVNNVRQRAYENSADYRPWTTLTMSALQDERCRELYHESTRRTDLIRWNLWCNGYTWAWKGGVEMGTNLPEYTKSFPIPNRVMTSSTLQQQNGY